MTLLSPGARVGRYSLVSLLGKGGMGQVWEAVLEGPHGFRKPVALKLLNAGSLGDSQQRALMQEARLGALLAHPNVVATLELGQAEGRWFVAMELVRGVALSRLARGSLPSRAVVEVGIGAAAALAHVHGLDRDGQALGLVHRDVKLGNLLVDRSGLVKLADLGIATIGQDGTTAGTPGYMAPEQADGRHEARSDLFALGATLYRLATSRPPFGKGRAALARLGEIETIVSDPAFFVPVEAQVPGLGAVLHRCLRGDPEDRWPDARALGSALHRVMAELPPGPGLLEVLRAAHVDVAPVGSGGVPTPSSSADTVMLHPATLPALQDRFVGRRRERTALTRRVLDSAGWITLRGLGGVGKTRLSLEVAWQVRDQLPGGALFCDLSDARSYAGLVHAVASALSVPLSTSDPAVQIGHAFRARGRCLVVLDNLEQCIEPVASAAAQWLALAPETSFLATSRVPVEIAGESMVDVQPLSEAGAMELFRARCRRELAEEDEARLAALVRDLDRLPLAIELAAARTRVLSVVQIHERLSDRFRLLQGGERNRPARQRSLRASLDGSWELLEPWAQRALAQLSVFAGGCTLEAAEAVLELGSDAPWAIDALDVLAASSLVVVDGSRFVLLDSVRAYAAEQLEEAEDARRRHAAYFAQFGTRDALRALEGPDGARVWPAHAAELDNLIAAARWAQATDRAALGVPLILAGCRILARQGPVQQHEHMLDEGLERWPDDLRLMVESAGAHRSRGEQLAAALSAARAAGDLELEAAALRALAASRQFRYDTDGAVRYAREAEAVARAVGDPLGRAWALTHAGHAAYYAGRMDDARTAYEEALSLQRARGGALATAALLSNLANLHRAQGRFEQARASHGQALALYRQLGARGSMAEPLRGLGVIATDQGDAETALEFLDRALARYLEMGSRHGEAAVLAERGRALGALGRNEEAIAAYTEVASVQEELGDRASYAVALGNLGGLNRKAGRLADADALLRRAVAIGVELAYTRMRCAFQVELARVHLAQGEPIPAGALLEEAIQDLTEAGDRVQLADAWAVRLRAALDADDAAGVTLALGEIDALGDQMPQSVRDEVDGLRARSRPGNES